MAVTDGEQVEALALENAELRRKLADSESLSSASPFFTALTSVCNTTTDVIFVKDVDGVYIFMNEAGARLAGRKSHEFSGGRDEDFYGEEAAAEFRKIDQFVIASGETQTVEEKLVFEGKLLRFLSVKSPFFDSNGKILGTFGIARDVTKALQLQDELQWERDSRVLAQKAGGFGIWDLDYAAGRQYVSPECGDLLGGELDNALPVLNAFWRYVHPDNRESGLADMRAALSACSLQSSFKHRILRPDGKTCWVSTANCFEYAANGEVVRWYGAMVDITAREEAEIRLNELVLKRTAQLTEALTRVTQSEVHYRQLFDAIEDGILVHDFSGRILDCNEAFQRALGYTGEELLNMHTADIDTPEFSTDFEQRLAQQRKHGRHRFEGVHFSKGGSRIPVDIMTSTMNYHGQEAVLALVRDITAIKRAEAEKAALMAQILHTQKLESLGVLSGGIAHDFNNLLMGVLGNADLALDVIKESDPGHAELEDIQLAARKAADLCRQLLAYSGKGRFLIRPIDLNRTIREMQSLIDLSANKIAQISYHLAPILPAIEADGSQISQVVVNLISNAAEAIEGKNGLVSVTTDVLDCDETYLLSTFADSNCMPGRYVTLEVSDNGSGMDADTKTRIFDPFFTTKETGRGLGLAAVIGIIRGHGGTIKVYSEEGHGTTFKVLLPACQENAVAPVPNSETRRWNGRGLILLVDDEVTVHKVATRILKTKNFDVVIACDGYEALDVYRVRHDEIACVVLDLTMPRMGGQEAFRELTRINPDVRVILSSGYNEQDAVRQFAGKGRAAFVQKPYQSKDLLDAILDVLDGTEYITYPDE